MNKYLFFISSLILTLYSCVCLSAHCPDPQTTSLKSGVPPAPWVVNPFSSNPPQSDDTTRFSRANILVAGLGRGVMCTYVGISGEFSIWWPVLTKIPARTDYQWINTQGGFVCSEGLELCQFFTAS